MSLSGPPCPAKENLIVRIARLYSKADVLRETARRNGHGILAADLLEIMHDCDTLKKEVLADLSTDP